MGSGERIVTQRDSEDSGQDCKDISKMFLHPWLGKKAKEHKAVAHPIGPWEQGAQDLAAVGAQAP